MTEIASDTGSDPGSQNESDNMPDNMPGNTPGSPTESRARIVVRRPIFRLGMASAGSGESASQAIDSQESPRAIPRHWWGGDPFKTHFMDALSSTFPMGESFFVRSVRNYADRIEDPILLEQIRGFAGQEGQHSRIHDEHVRLLVSQGYGALETRNRVVDKILRWHNRRAPALSLAVTAALEHLTSIFARQVLENSGGWVDDMDPEMKRLWRWHALEEAEHKTVAFDVLKVVAPGRGLRSFALAMNTLGLAAEVLERMIYMFWKDGLLFDSAAWNRGWRFLFGRKGFLRGIGKDYRAWYRADFHPNDIDDRRLIEIELSLIAAEIST